MIRRQWEFMDNALSQLSSSPTSMTAEECTAEIYRYLKQGYLGDSTTQDEQAMECCAFLYTDMVRNDNLVITPADIEDAVEFTLMDPNSEQKLLLSREIPSYFGAANLYSVEGRYCNSDYRRFEDLWIAPVIKSAEAIIEQLGTPPAISSITIDQLMLRELQQNSESGERGQTAQHQSVDSEEADVLAAWVKSELEGDGWQQVETGETNIRVWANPSHLIELVSENGDELSEDEIDQILIRAITGSVTDLPPSLEFVLDGLLASIKRRLNREHDWRPLSTADEKKWYKNHTSHRIALENRFSEHHSVLKAEDDVSDEQLEETANFLEDNEAWILNYTGIGREANRYFQRRLRALIESHDTWDQLSQAIIKTHTDDIETTFETETGPTTYDIAREMERKIEEAREEEDDEEGPDKGVGGFRF